MMEISIELIIGSVALVIAVISTLFVIYVYLKNKVISDIKHWVRVGRQQTGVWDKKSEGKLVSWMDGFELDTLHRASLLKLFTIRKNVIEYVNIHILESIDKW